MIPTSCAAQVESALRSHQSFVDPDADLDGPPAEQAEGRERWVSALAASRSSTLVCTLCGWGVGGA